MLFLFVSIFPHKVYYMFFFRNKKFCNVISTLLVSFDSYMHCRAVEERQKSWIFCMPKDKQYIFWLAGKECPHIIWLYCQFYYKLQKLGRERGKACNVNHVYQREYIGKCLWNFGKIWHLFLLKMLIASSSSKWGHVLWYTILMCIYSTLHYIDNCKERNEVGRLLLSLPCTNHI